VKVFFISIFIVLFLPLYSLAQVLDSSLQKAPLLDTTISSPKINNVSKNLLDSNIFINANGTAQALVIIPKKQSNNQLFFYIITLLFLILGITKTSYSRYFNTLFRVFFNTSLRQNQLTDQLEQAKLPSLIFNVFFIITSGFYTYLLTQFWLVSKVPSNKYLLFFCIMAVAICYTVKYLSLLFTGWLTSSSAETKTYIFIIFLLNKVIGIFLLAVIPIIAFGNKTAASYAILFSLIGISLFFLLRFFRSYALLQTKLKISRIHFFIYVVSLEILPLAIISKFILHFFDTNS
jgi:hypothetical protein